MYVYKKYDEVLKEDVDYIGTRLHGGIKALNAGRRSLIIAVDNRAIEISKDTGLPVIGRDEFKTMLENKINDSIQPKIVLPTDNIVAWKNQFSRGICNIVFCMPFHSAESGVMVA